MQIGELVLVDMGYENSYGKRKPFQLAIIRDIMFRYDPPRYHLTVVATGKRISVTKRYIFSVEEE